MTRPGGLPGTPGRCAACGGVGFFTIELAPGSRIKRRSVCVRCAGSGVAMVYRTPVGRKYTRRQDVTT